MSFLEFLTNKGGLLVIQLVILSFFITLLYILSVEFRRTGRKELKSKLIAVSSTILQIVVTIIALFFSVFLNQNPSQRFVPIFTSTLTITTIVFLWHAFLYSSIKDNKKIGLYAKIVFIFIITVFVSVMLFWNISFVKGDIFVNSIYYLLMELFFIAIDILVIFTISKFKSRYKHRVITGFVALLVVHGITIINYFHNVDAVTLVIKSFLPIVVPIMFGSVMFKELLDHIVNLNRSLRSSLLGQGELIAHIGGLNYRINKIKDSVYENALFEKDSPEFKKIDEEFTTVIKLLGTIDMAVFDIMEKVAEYDEIIMK